MPKGFRMTRENARQVLMNIANRMDTDEGDADVYCDEMNSMLDELLGQDFFGTEGQLDPRGDRRDL